MFARLCAARSDLLAGRCCCCPPEPGGRLVLSRARAAAPSGSEAEEESSGAAARGESRPKRSCCVVSGAPCECLVGETARDENVSATALVGGRAQDGAGTGGWTQPRCGPCRLPWPHKRRGRCGPAASARSRSRRSGRAVT